jgi:ABC-type Fe3+/spermidine/putrescine transport system ATPase subunit
MADRVAVMDGGRLLQIAPPRELYERPSSRRVAEFFGDTNVWPATVGAGTLNVPDLQLSVPSPGGGCAVALRPERIRISRTPLDGDCRAHGVVQDAVYLGLTSTYFVKTPSGAVVRVTVQNGDGTSMFARGDNVHLAWSAAALSVLPE